MAVILVAVVVMGLISKMQLTEPLDRGVAMGKAGIVQVAFGDKKAATEIEDDGIFTIVTRSMGQETNPIFATQEGERMAVDLIFEPLARRDSDGVLQTILAESIVYSEEKHVATVTIKNDILFSDGTPLEMEDVMVSLLLALLTSATGTEYIAGIDEFLAGATSLPLGLQMVNETTLQIIFDTYDLQNEQLFEIPIQKMTEFDFSATMTDLGTYTKETLGKGIGTNAYRLDENTMTQAYLVENEYYREPIESVKTVHIYDVDSIYIDQLIENQTVDYIYFGSQDAMLQTLVDDPRYSVYGKETSTVIGLMVNETSVPMKNYHLRQAVHYAIDRYELMPEVHWYRYKPVSSILPSSAYFEVDAELESERDKAEESYATALEQLGFATFFMTLPIIEGNDLYESVADGVQKELEEIGINVNVKKRTTEEYIDSLYLMNDYDLYLEEVTLLGTQADYGSYATQFFESTPDNFAGIWENIAKAVTDEEKILAYETANQVMRENSLFIPIARGQNFVGIASSWSGYEITPFTNVPENLHKCIYG